MSIREGSLEKSWLILCLFSNSFWGGGFNDILGVLKEFTGAVLNLVDVCKAATSSAVELLNVEWDFVGKLCWGSILDSFARLHQVVVSEIVGLWLVSNWLLINWLCLLSWSIFLNQVPPGA